MKHQALRYSFVAAICAAIAWLLFSRSSTDQAGGTELDREKPGHTHLSETAESPGEARQENSRLFLANQSKDELAALGREFGLSDPLAGLRALENSNLAFDQRWEFLQALFAAWAEVDPEAAASHLMTNFDQEVTYRDHLAAVLKTWATQAPAPTAEKLLQWLQEHPDKKVITDEYYLARVLETWAGADPQQALSWLQEKGDITRRQSYELAILSEWAKRDPQTAIALADSVGQNAREQKDIYNAVLTQWARTDADLAAEWFNHNLTGVDDPITLGMAASEIAEQLYEQHSFERAIGWLDTITGAKIREQAVTDLIMAWTSDIEDGQTQVLDALQSRYLAGDTSYGPHLEEAALQIAMEAPERVGDWLNQRDKFGTFSDRVISGFVHGLKASEPGTAYLWTTQIQDPILREKAGEDVLSTWADQDKAGMTQWLNTPENQEMIGELSQSQPHER